MITAAASTMPSKTRVWLQGNRPTIPQGQVGRADQSADDDRQRRPDRQRQEGLEHLRASQHSRWHPDGPQAGEPTSAFGHAVRTGDGQTGEACGGCPATGWRCRRGLGQSVPFRAAKLVGPAGIAVGALGAGLDRWQTDASNPELSTPERITRSGVQAGFEVGLGAAGAGLALGLATAACVASVVCAGAVLVGGGIVGVIAGEGLADTVLGWFD